MVITLRGQLSKVLSTGTRPTTMPAIRAMATQEALSGIFIVYPRHSIFCGKNVIAIAADEREGDHVSDEFFAPCRKLQNRCGARTRAEGDFGYRKQRPDAFRPSGGARSASPTPCVTRLLLLVGPGCSTAGSGSLSRAQRFALA